MTDNRPPPSDPFTDHPRQTHFTEPQRPFTSLSSDSSTTLHQPSESSHTSEPFANRPRQTHFAEPPRPYHAAPSVAYESTTTLHPEYDGQNDYQNEDYIEKVPLTSGQNFSGTAGFYPPMSVFSFI
jgi:hypothetical protein